MGHFRGRPVLWFAAESHLKNRKIEKARSMLPARTASSDAFPEDIGDHKCPQNEPERAPICHETDPRNRLVTRLKPKSVVSQAFAMSSEETLMSHACLVAGRKKLAGKS
jgi:hypothetical protein